MKILLTIGTLFLAAVAPAAALRPSTNAVPSSSPTKSFVAPLKVYPMPSFGRMFFEPVLEVGAGTPTQTLHMIMDTGSFFPVVYNQSCSVPDCGPLTTKYNSALSSTASIQYNHPALLQYGGGNCSGYYGMDNFTYIAQPSSSDTTKINYQINSTIVDNVSWKKNQNGLAAVPMDGIFGVGPYSEYYPDTNSRVLVEQYGLEMIAVTMPRGSPFKSGSVQFGGYDQLLPAGSSATPTWAESTEPYLFYVNIDDIQVNGKSTWICKLFTGACRALLDTGGGVFEFSDVFWSKEKVFFNCDELGSMPNVSVVINGTALVLEPLDYVYKLPNGTCQSLIITHLYSEEQVTAMSKAKAGWLKPPKPIRSVSIHQMADITQEEATRLGGFHIGALDFPVTWTSRVTTIFDYVKMRAGFIQHD